MTVRIVQPADGTGSVSFGWDLAQVSLQAGQLVSVDPGSAFENAVGVSNLLDPSVAELDSAQQGSSGWISN